MPSNRKLLTSSDEVIALAATDNNVDPRQLMAAIQIAEERFIKPMLCKDFYYDFRDKKNVTVTVLNKSFLESEINDGNTGDSVVLEIGDIVNAIENVTNNYYVSLWYEHLWKFCAETVVYIASPTNFSRFTAQGELELKPKVFGTDAQGSSSVDLNTMKWKMDRMMMDRIDPLIGAMDEWLFDNKSYFPLMNCRNWDFVTRPNGVSVKRKTAWIHNVYDDFQSPNMAPCYKCSRNQ